MFELYKKDTIKFEIDGSNIELDIARLTATETLQFNSRIGRVDPDLDDSDTHSEMILIYLDLLVSIIRDVRGVEGLDEWPDDDKGRRQILNLCGFQFVISAADAYISSSSVKESEEGK